MVGGFGGLASGGFSIGSVPVFGIVPGDNPDVAGASVGSNPGGWASIINTAIKTGVDVWKTEQTTDLLKTQIKYGQNPTIIRDTSGSPVAPVATYQSTRTPSGETTVTASGVAAAAAGVTGPSLTSWLSNLPVWALALVLVVVVLMLSKK